MPTMWPGFSWHNLSKRKRTPVPPVNSIPRLGGRFMWSQAYRFAADWNIKTIWMAQFDEVDEGTAIFKVAQTDSELPAEGNYLTLDVDGESLPRDWYLRLCGEAQKMLDGRIPLTSEIPINNSKEKEDANNDGNGKDKLTRKKIQEVEEDKHFGSTNDVPVEEEGVAIDEIPAIASTTEAVHNDFINQSTATTTDDEIESIPPSSQPVDEKIEIEAKEKPINDFKKQELRQYQKRLFRLLPSILLAVTALIFGVLFYKKSKDEKLVQPSQPTGLGADVEDDVCKTNISSTSGMYVSILHYIRQQFMRFQALPHHHVP